MNDTYNGCVNSVELRNMIEQVAEKAAKQAAESVQSSIKIEMMQLERNLEDKMSRKFDSKLSAYFGMTPQEHAVEHDRVRKFYTMVEDASKEVFKKILIGVIIVALGVSGAKMTDLKAVVSQKPDISKDRRVSNEAN